MDINKYLQRPISPSKPGFDRYARFDLSDNPFPASPFVNPDSRDSRTNGDIYEPSIRQAEYDKFRRSFLEVAQSDANHLRLGYLMDTSYVGRGNGKSAFLLYLQKRINKDFAFDVSNGHNRCFSTRVVPDPSGKTKTFESFVDQLASSIFQSTVIDDALASLRLEAIIELDGSFDPPNHFSSEEELRSKLNSEGWYKNNGIDFRRIHQQILESERLQNVPYEFPLYQTSPLIPQVVSTEDFIEYYTTLKRGRSRYDFIFSHLVEFFSAARFNGAYIFVDDFERIPDFQSARQKQDFAVELRSCLFDGPYTNARIGFFNLLLILHAGIPRLIQSAWEQSGLEHRAPIFYKGGTPRHVIRFEKIGTDDTISLLRTYLDKYRVEPGEKSGLEPFTEEAVITMAELSEYNASRLLKMAYEAIERAADHDRLNIDKNFVLTEVDALTIESRPIAGIHDTPTINLQDEVKG